MVLNRDASHYASMLAVFAIDANKEGDEERQAEVLGEPPLV